MPILIFYDFVIENIVTSNLSLTYDIVTKYIPIPQFIAGKGKEGYNT